MPVGVASNDARASPDVGAFAGRVVQADPEVLGRGGVDRRQILVDNGRLEGYLHETAHLA
jgi:hypothetical protein